MHLFVIHQFPDLDEYTPIIYKLDHKLKGMVKILSVFLVHDFREYELVKFLIKQKIQYYSLSKINLKNYFLNLFLKVIFLLPTFILFKLNILWHYLYHNADLFTADDICKFIEKEKIKSITIDDGLSDRFQKIFYDSCVRMDIKLIKYVIGINLRKNLKVEKNQLEYCHKYIISEAMVTTPEEINLKKKIVRINSARYSIEWLEILEKINYLKLKDYKPYFPNKDKLKIVIFTRPFINYIEWKKIEEKINSLGNTEVRLKIKPRGDLSPLSVNRQTLQQFTSSELINWADLVVSHISSILAEVLMKNKPLFYLDYITKDKYKETWNYYTEFKKKNKIQENTPFYLDKDLSAAHNHLVDHSFFVKINSLDHLIKEIVSFSKNVQNSNENELKDKKNFLKKVLGNQYESKGQLDKYVNFYKNL